jgi:hypothetical protein
MFITVVIAIFYFKLSNIWSSMKNILPKVKFTDEESMEYDSG